MKEKVAPLSATFPFKGLCVQGDLQQRALAERDGGAGRQGARQDVVGQGAQTANNSSQSHVFDGHSTVFVAAQFNKLLDEFHDIVLF